MATGTHTVTMIGTQANTDRVIQWFRERYQHADGFTERSYYYKWFACGEWFKSDSFATLPATVKLNHDGYLAP